MNDLQDAPAVQKPADAFQNAVNRSGAPGTPAAGGRTAERRSPARPGAKRRRQLRLVGLAITGLLPQGLKRAVYRWVFGYRISPSARIGIALLDCAGLTVGEHTTISHGVVFLSCGRTTLGANVRIGPLNLFRGGDRIQLDDYAQLLRFNVINAILDHDSTDQPDSSFYLGYGSVITAEHRIDFTDRVQIGRRSILAGRNSSIWTHNIRTGKPVEVGDYCYVGSEMRMAPGSRIPDYSIVGLGSVITRDLGKNWGLYAGVPAVYKRALRADDLPMIFGRTRPDLPDEDEPPVPFDIRGDDPVEAPATRA